VLFEPFRSGHGGSPGVPLTLKRQDFLANVTTNQDRREVEIRLLEFYLPDIEQALNWIQLQPYADAKRVFLAGQAYGGAETLLGGGQNWPGVRGCIAFNPAAQMWNSTLSAHFRAAVEQTRVPVLLLQAENGYGLGPSQDLGPQLEARGAPNRCIVYPAFGNQFKPEDGSTKFALQGQAVWGEDVLSFLQASGREGGR
jgi:dienelactone hydrolase